MVPERVTLPFSGSERSGHWIAGETRNSYITKTGIFNYYNYEHGYNMLHDLQDSLCITPFISSW